MGFINQQGPGKDPYFLYVPFTAPHKPTQPSKAFRGKTSLSEYGDFIAQVDDAVGQILTAIENNDRANDENTLVVFTSDNGSYMYRYDDDRADHTDNDSIQGYRAANHRANGPWRGTKADIYEAGHHVPFFLRWPSEITAGSTADQTICQVDLYATCAQVAGYALEDEEAEDSFSILEMARGADATRPAPVIHQSGSGMLAFRKGDWKLIAGNGSGGRQKPRGTADTKPFQLFNLKIDPQEKNNVASEQAEQVDKMTQELNALRDSKGSRATYRVSKSD